MENLAEAIHNKKARVAVIGLGHVGLPVACTLAEAGFQVLGIERNEAKAAHIGAGICPIGGNEPRLARLLTDVIDEGKLRVGTDYAECRETGGFARGPT